MKHYCDHHTYDHHTHSHTRVKKKKKKKKSNNSIYVLLFFFSISVILYFNSNKLVDFTEDLKSDSGISTLSISTNSRYKTESEELKKKDEDDSLRTIAIHADDEIRTNLLLDSFNLKKFEEDTYKLKNFGEELIENIEIIKNNNFIFDAITYLVKGIKHSNLYPFSQKDKPTLRNEKGKKFDASEIKRFIILKLLKLIAFLILLYIIIRLISLFFKSVINFTFVLIFKIIKYCCCGGK